MAPCNSLLLWITVCESAALAASVLWLDDLHTIWKLSLIHGSCFNLLSLRPVAASSLAPPVSRGFVCSFPAWQSLLLLLSLPVMSFPTLTSGVSAARQFTAHVPKRLPMVSVAEMTKRHGPVQYEAKAFVQRSIPLVRPNPVLLNADENRRQVLKMYRKVVRSVPRVLLAYEISGGPLLEREALANVRSHFDRHVAVTDLGVAAVLRHKAEMEVQESLMMWKTKSHVCTLMLNDSAPLITAITHKQKQHAQDIADGKVKESQFMSSFLQG